MHPRRRYPKSIGSYTTAGPLESSGNIAKVLKGLSISKMSYKIPTRVCIPPDTSPIARFGYTSRSFTDDGIGRRERYRQPGYTELKFGHAGGGDIGLRLRLW
jgi:hypothetical protein